MRTEHDALGGDGEGADLAECEWREGTQEQSRGKEYGEECE